MTKDNTAGVPFAGADRISWGLEDRIRWVEWRIRELTISQGKYVDERGRWLLEEKAVGGRKLEPGDQLADYAAWILHARGDLSWHQLAYRFFPFATEEHIEGYKSKVRRMSERVERKHPGSKLFRPSPLSREDKHLLNAVMLGVVPVYLEKDGRVVR